MTRSSLPHRKQLGRDASTSITIQRSRFTPGGGPHRASQPGPASSQTPPVTAWEGSFAHDFSAVPVRGRAPIDIQPKLSMNTPGDRHEREADRLADAVMRMPEPAAGGEPIATSRTDAGASIQTKPLAEGGPREGRGEPASRLAGSGGGTPLPGDVRGFMESRFGADFGHVRVHTGPEAARLSRSLNAQAFTHSRDIYFGAGRAPGKDALTAHELTHVLQQTGGEARQEASPRERGGTPAIQRVIELRPPGRGEASAFDRRQELVDRLNAQSTAIQYSLRDGDRVLEYTVADEGGLRNFDRQMMGFIDNAALIPLRLITSAGRVGGGGVFVPVIADAFASGYVDLDDLLASDDLAFQSILVHFLTERARTRNYARRIGTAGLRDNAVFTPAHNAGHDAQALHFRDVLGDDSIRFNYEEIKANGDAHIVFQSRDRGYWIFVIVHRIRREVSNSEVRIRTTDRRWMSVPDFLAEQAAAMPEE